MWKVSEVEQNAAVGRDPQPLSEEEREWLADERARWDRRYCRLCYTCEPCPKGVQVQSLMILDLNYRRFGREIMREREVPEALAAIDNCRTCRECVVKCAYDLPIRELMIDTQRKYKPIFEDYVNERAKAG